MMRKRPAERKVESNKFYVSSKTNLPKLIKKALKLKKFKLSGMGRQTQKVVEAGLKIRSIADCVMNIHTSTCTVYDDIYGLDEIETSTRLQSCIEIQVEVLKK